jgi:hypothetical protein
MHTRASKLRSRLRALKHERSNTTYLGPLGFTPREAGQSEQERAPEAKLQQPASRERSNTTYLGALGFTPREAGQSEQVAKQVASAKNRPRASSELMRAVEERDRMEGDRKKLKMRSMERGDRQFKPRTRAREPPSRAFAISRVPVS